MSISRLLVACSFPLTTLILGNSDVNGFGNHSFIIQDQIVLTNGKVLSGTISLFPGLVYSFGNVHINPEDVTFFSRELESPLKWRILTSNGSQYIAPLGGDELFIRVCSSDDESCMSAREIKVLLSDINSITLHPRPNQKSRPAYQLTLKDGNEVPVDLLDKVIYLNEGKLKKSIDASDIIDLSFNGALQGSVKNKNGEITHIGLCYVDCPYVSLKLAGRTDVVRLPWQSVAFLDRVEERAETVIDLDEVSEAGPLFKDYENFEVLEIELHDAAKALLSGSQGFDIPEVEFLAPNKRIPREKKSQLKDKSTKEIIALAKDIVAAKRKRNGLKQCFQRSSSNDQNINQYHSEENISAIEFKAPLLEDDIDDQNLNQYYNEEKDSAIESEEPMLEDSIDFSSYLDEDAPIAASDVHIPLKGESGQVFDEMPEENQPSDVFVSYSSGTSSGFYISRKKVSNEDYQKFIHAVGYKPPPHWIGGQIPSGQEAFPVVNVTYKDILLYSVWTGKRLPAFDELRAASNFSNGLIDKEDHVNEWTSTQSSLDDAVIADQAVAGIRMSENAMPSYVIYGNQNVSPLQNGEFNSYTGFRLVSAKD